MPALKPTDHIARVVWLGAVKDSETHLPSAPVTEMPLSFAGYSGECHAGVTRPSCSRVSQQYPKGTEIRNVRQLSILSQEELDVIATKLELAQMDPQLMGASVVIAGIPDFSHVPPSSRLIAESGPGLIIDMENRPCHLPAPFIDAAHPGHGKGIKAAAKGLRGVTASVEREGTLQLGMSLRLHVPDQPAWAGLS